MLASPSRPFCWATSLLSWGDAVGHHTRADVLAWPDAPASKDGRSRDRSGPQPAVQEDRNRPSSVIDFHFGFDFLQFQFSFDL